jgi:hypothetical protein
MKTRDLILLDGFTVQTNYAFNPLDKTSFSKYAKSEILKLHRVLHSFCAE